MSTLKVDSIESRTSGNRVVLPDTNNYPPYRNIIINGDMSVAQRGTSATGIGNGDTGYHTVDRWEFFEAGSPTFEFTQSQESDTPSGQGFKNSLKMNCTTAQASLGADVACQIRSVLEGQNLQHLKYGTSSAESLTISFWVKSSKTGTYIFELYSGDNDKQVSKSYTINSANTWEKKTITIAGDTAASLDNDNAGSLQATFCIGAGTDYTSGTLNETWNARTNANRYPGQVNLADSTSNDWYVTGVQLEVGDSATPFEFLPYDVNLRRCYRYYWGWWDKADADSNGATGGLAVMYTSTNLYSSGFFPVTMRATPSLDQASGTNYYRFYRDGANDDFDDFALSGAGRENKNGWEMRNSTDVSGTGGQAGFIRCNNVNAYIFFDAEL